MNEWMTSHGVLPMARDCDSCEVGVAVEVHVWLCACTYCVCFSITTARAGPPCPVCYSPRSSLPCQGWNQVQARLHMYVICLSAGATRPWERQEGAPRCQQRRARLGCGAQVNMYLEFLLFEDSSVLDPLPKENVAHEPCKEERPSLTCPQTLGAVESVIFGDGDLAYIWEE